MARETVLSKRIRKNTSEADRRMDPPTSQVITKEKLERLLPKYTRKEITDELLEHIATMGETTNLSQKLLEEDLMSYTHLINHQITMKTLVDAVKFCNLKRHHTVAKAWEIVFPELAQNRFKQSGKGGIG